MVGERLLLYYKQCLCCELTGPRRVITHDHSIPKVTRSDHGLVVKQLSADPRNIAPVCEPHHKGIDRNKFKQFYNNGIAGLIGYLGSGYPEGIDPEMRLVWLCQREYLISGLVDRLEGLNGDAPNKFREDYHRAVDVGRNKIYTIKTRLSEFGIYENPYMLAKPPSSSLTVANSDFSC
jgi:hypothetical protein